MDKPLRALSIIGSLILCVSFTFPCLATFGHVFNPFEIQGDTLNGRFPKSYEYSRLRFLARVQELQKTFPKSELLSFQVPSGFDQALYTDLFYLHAGGKPEKLLIFLTGVHGGEAYLANAQMWTVLEHAETLPLEKTAVVFVHALNPFGMKYFKRTTENNVDLNRNFSEDNEFSSLTNQAYEKLSPSINETASVAFFGFENFLLLPKLVLFMLKESKDALTQATAGGQFQFPQGIFYGGQQQEPQVKFLIQNLKKWGESAKQILLLDLHTGYGERGRLHLFGSPGLQQAHLDFTNKVFSEFDLNLGGSKNFYKTTGDTVSYFSRLWSDKDYAGMCLEMGTRNSQSTWGSFVSLQAIRLENQGVQFGYASEADYKRSREVTIETFLPADSEWRAQGIEQFQLILQKALAHF